MKYIVIFILIVQIQCTFGQIATDKNPFLFSFVDGAKCGFVDSSGKIAIEPIFYSADDFSEGLSAARVNGTYGYINQTGKFVIPAQFDYATAFHNGFAIVYNNGKPFYIRKNGQKAFDCPYAELGVFENGKAMVKTYSKKYGYVDQNGKLIIDTAYTYISPFANGLAIIRGIDHTSGSDMDKSEKENYGAGIIDSLGRIIVPFGKFTNILDYENGYFKVVLSEGKTNKEDEYSHLIGFMDQTEKIVMTRKEDSDCKIDGNIHDGLIKVSLYQHKLAGKENNSYSSQNAYEGFMDLKGNVMINDTNYRYAYDFCDRRAFVKDKKWTYSIIDTKGNLIAKGSFRNVLNNTFAKGLAFVEVGNKWGLIDTSAHFIIQPKFDEIVDLGMIDDYFFFRDANPTLRTLSRELYGIAKKDGSRLVDTILQSFDKRGFVNGLLYCRIDNKNTYINKKGQIIWQQQEKKPIELSNLNIDVMNRGYFYASSERNKNDLGGFGGSRNKAKKIQKKDQFLNHTLSVWVQTESRDTIYNMINGMKVFVANTTPKAIDFSAQDSRLYMKVQALNNQKEWKDIEYLPSSTCGNSYHTLSLAPQTYWSFITPRYEGDFKTKLRIELKYIDPKNQSSKRRERKEIIIYSNEYDGSVNPAQFWRKDNYSPNGIMDPYED